MTTKALPFHLHNSLLPIAVLFLMLITAVIPDATAASKEVLPFDPLPYHQLVGGKRKVFAHYFTPFPRSIDNLSPLLDYYTRHYLLPTGENGKYKAQGGFLRARPLVRAIDPFPDWQHEDMFQEVQQAKAIGLDGFAVDILNYEGIHWERTKQLLKAAEMAGGGFSIMLMPDMNAALKHNPSRFVQMIVELSRYPAAMRLPDGRLVISPYMAHLQTAQWWKTQLAALKNRGINVAFVPLFHDWRKYAKTFAPFSYGISDWGARNPAPASKLHWQKMAASAHAEGMIWMAPVAPQDVRPKSSFYFESSNSTMFRNQWEAAIQGNADWVQLVTWNDYSESTSIAPNTMTGHAFYDLSAYYITKFKTGKNPPIKRDVIYSFYRTHATSARPNPLFQTKLMVPGNGSAPPENNVEMLAFLTAPATLEIELAGKIHRRSATKGMIRFIVPLKPGTPHFRIVRNGKVVSSLKGRAITKTITVQNLLNFGDSSLR